MNNNHLPCFNAYDIRGRLGVELNEEIAYRIGRSAAEVLKVDKIVVGYDARASSPELAASVADAIHIHARRGETIDLGGAAIMGCYG